MSGAVAALEVVAAVLIATAAVAVSIRAAGRYSAYDVPDGARKLQAHPIPRLGGVAVAIAFSAVIIGAMFVSGQTALLPQVLGILLPAIGVATIGYVDDAHGLTPSLRLVLQSLAAVVAFWMGTRVGLTGSVLVDAVLTVGFIVVVVNGVNLLDNTDGLAATTVLISAAASTVIAIVLGQDVVAILGAALVGVCIGFLIHNWFPARVYLGDAGAYLLGFLLAALVIRLRPDSAPPVAGVAVAVLLVALPLVDTLFVVVRRLLAGRHPFTAGRDHLSHVLQERGRSVPGAVLALQIAPSIAALGALLLAATTLS